jgi:hypothetical protein
MSLDTITAVNRVATVGEQDYKCNVCEKLTRLNELQGIDRILAQKSYMEKTRRIRILGSFIFFGNIIKY